MPIFTNGHDTLHYYEYGSGPEIMLAFHGFGMRGTQFQVLEPAFCEKYRIYSFDLFFHGDTLLGDSSLPAVRKGLSAEHFGDIIRDFIHSIDAGEQKVSLLSYSMGSLMALSVLKTIPEYISSAFFIAPDGLKPNRLLQIGTRNKLVNRFFHQLVYSPKTVNFGLNCLLKFRYIDSSLYKILSREFASEATRLTCYNAITYYARLKFRQDEIAEIINGKGISTYLYFGKRDKLFPAEIGRAFSARLRESHLEILDEGHELVNSQLCDLIKQQLSKHDQG